MLPDEPVILREPEPEPEPVATITMPLSEYQSEHDYWRDRVERAEAMGLATFDRVLLVVFGAGLGLVWVVGR